MQAAPDDGEAPGLARVEQRVLIDLVVPPDQATALTELLARIRAVLRRRNPDLTRVLRVGDLSIDTATREVRAGKRSIDLSVREYDLLLFLASNADQVLPRQRILDEVWG